MAVLGHSYGYSFLVCLDKQILMCSFIAPLVSFITVNERSSGYYVVTQIITIKKIQNFDLFNIFVRWKANHNDARKTLWTQFLRFPLNVISKSFESDEWWVSVNFTVSFNLETARVKFPSIFTCAPVTNFDTLRYYYDLFSPARRITSTEITDSFMSQILYHALCCDTL